MLPFFFLILIWSFSVCVAGFSPDANNKEHELSDKGEICENNVKEGRNGKWNQKKESCRKLPSRGGGHREHVPGVPPRLTGAPDLGRGTDTAGRTSGAARGARRPLHSRAPEFLCPGLGRGCCCHRTVCRNQHSAGFTLTCKAATLQYTKMRTCFRESWKHATFSDCGGRGPPLSQPWLAAELIPGRARSRRARSLFDFLVLQLGKHYLSRLISPPVPGLSFGFACSAQQALFPAKSPGVLPKAGKLKAVWPSDIVLEKSPTLS